MPCVPVWSTCPSVNVPTCEKRANFSCLCANVSTCQYMCQRVSVPKSCLLLAFQFFNCSCQKAYQFFNYFSKESFNFWIFQICLTFANFKNIWAVLETSSRETKNLNFDFCKTQKAYQFFNYFSKEFFNFWIFQISRIFGQF